VTLILGFGFCAFWIIKSKLTVDAVKTALVWSLLGSAFSIFVCVVIYKVNGPELPSFIPPEESAESGLLLGLSAGMLEEIVFRLALLPLVFIFLLKKLPNFQAMVLSSILIGILFALSHELTGDAFQLRYFITRIIAPGFIMSMLFLKLHPAALLSAHSAAHIGIAMLFTVSVDTYSGK